MGRPVGSGGHDRDMIDVLGGLVAVLVRCLLQVLTELAMQMPSEMPGKETLKVCCRSEAFAGL